MAEQRCKRVYCDYRGCTAWAIVDELSAKEKSADGGYTRWNEYEYEHLPEGWTKQFINRKHSDLCPVHSAEYETIVQNFIEEVVE